MLELPSDHEKGLAIVALARIADKEFGDGGGTRHLIIDHMEFSIECRKQKDSIKTDRFIITNLVTKHKFEVLL